MSKNSNTQIVNKKLLGSKLLYLLINQNSKKWIDYDQLTDFLPQIIDYERRINPIFAKNLYHQNQLSTPLCQKSSRKEKIKKIQFIDQIKGNFLFEVEYFNGQRKYKTNEQLKRENCELLCKYYQNNINIQ